MPQHTNDGILRERIVEVDSSSEYSEAGLEIRELNSVDKARAREKMPTTRLHSARPAASGYKRNDEKMRHGLVCLTKMDRLLSGLRILV